MANGIEKAQSEWQKLPFDKDISREHNVSSDSKEFIPVDIFNNDGLSALEAICKYLVEEQKLKFCEIAKIMNRDDRTIWGAYTSSKKKMSVRLSTNGLLYSVPLSIFRGRVLSVLESLTKHMKEDLNLKYCQIASLLNRNDRTIWTAYNRSKKKIIANESNE